MALRDIDPVESWWQYVTLTRVSQVAVRDSEQDELGRLYMILTRLTHGENT